MNVGRSPFTIHCLTPSPPRPSPARIELASPGIRALVYRREPRHTLNHAASSTAVTDGENVYAFFGDYGLVSYDSTGKERWRVPLGPFTIGWGPASSPVLVGDAAVVPLDGYVGSYIGAFESKTGKVRWRKERERLSHNYSTPIVRSTSNGGCEIVVLGPNKLVAYDPRDGRERWTAKVPGGSTWARTTATPTACWSLASSGRSTPC